MTSFMEENVEPTTPSRAKPRRRWSYVLPSLLILVSSILVVLQVTVWRGDGHPGGDPDGRLLEALTAEVPRTLPPSAKVMLQKEFPARWDTCGDRPGTGGWQPVRVLVTVDVPPSRTFDDDIARHLTGAGWSGPQQFGTEYSRWSRVLSAGRSAQLDVTPKSSTYSFVFTAQPPGPVPTGC